jgi:hypothetical protein
MRLFNHVDLNVIGVVATAEEISVIGLPERPLQFDYLPLIHQEDGKRGRYPLKGNTSKG